MGIGNAFYGVANLLINRGGLYPDKFTFRLFTQAPTDRE